MAAYDKYGMSNPFTVCFTMMKIRYMDYDRSIEGLQFLTPTDKVNVFINFESVLNNLSMVKDIGNKLLLERAFPIILEAEMVNLCAHYKKFFRGNGLDTKVYLYYTDLSSSEFANYRFNDEYRSFYTNKYMNNPRFQLLGDTLVDRIIPRVQTIMEFIPNVYFIKATNIEGSLIPWIIASNDPTRKNFVITSDRYETQYQACPKNFCTHYIKRSPLGSAIFCSFDKYLADLFKETNAEVQDYSIFKNPSYYTTLMSALGDKTRSIEPIKGVGCKTIAKSLQSAIEEGKLTEGTSSIEMIEQSLPVDAHDIITNFNCVSIEKQFNALDSKALFDIKNQCVDRFDYNSLLELNRKDYRDYPLMLEELTC
jgi:hypothetical protein